MKFRLLPHWKISRQKGGALFVLLAIVGIVAVLLVGTLTRKAAQIEHDKQTASVLAQAKDALIGYATTYRDSHPNEVFGYLLCPDINNDGVADEPCATADAPTIGRLPWKTLGLPPLRDGVGECLWYAISGTFKNLPKTSGMLNWDTNGQFVIQDSGGTTVAGATADTRSVAVIFSPGSTLNQNRTTSGTTECGGSLSASDYLESGNAFTPPASATPATTVTLVAGTADSNTNNDRLLWIVPGEIFRGIRQRSDFATDINSMVSDIAAWLNAKPATALPAPSATNKGMNNIITAYSPVGPQKTNVLNNWSDNLLYASISPSTKITVDGALSPSACNAVLIFGGARSGAQARITATDKASAANYLEGSNATSFPIGTTYSGASTYNKASPSNDIVACITGTSSGMTQVTFASNLGSFVTAGSGVTTSIPTQSITVADAPGNSGGCLWYPTAIPLNGKTLRAYYAFTFMNADPSGGVDLGNGLTLSFLRGDVGSPTAAACGTQSAMGVLGVSDLWGSLSFFVETDIHRDGGAINDPAGNHTAIMANGNLSHSALAGGNGYTTAACNGSAQGCLYSPANTFEESPTPLNHNQRIEIHTGCDSACAACNSGGSYAQIKAWTDCASCSDTTGDFASTPTASRCTTLDTSMGSIYFGFTAGFSSAGGGQGVTIRNLDLRTQ